MTKNPVTSQRVFYGWIIVACIFIFHFIAYGIRYSFSVFYVAILNEFKWSRADTAFIFSLNILLYGLTAPLSGVLADRFGPRKVILIGAMLLTIGMIGCSAAGELRYFYLFFGVIAAVGNCIAGFSQYLPLVARWFVENRVKALGMIMAGGGLCLFFSLLAESVINVVGWRNAFVVIGLIPSAVIIPLDLIFIKWPEEGSPSPKRDEETKATNEVEDVGSSGSVTLARALRSTSFWLMFLTKLLVWGVGLNMILAHIVAFMRDIGFDAVYSAFIFSSHGVFMAVGNACGFVADRFGKTRTFIVSSFGAILALFLLTTASVSSPWKLHAWLVLFGTGMGLLGPALSGIAVELFEGKHLGVINGCLILGFGIGGCVGPYIAGYVFDVTGTYIPVFYLAITAISVSCVLVWVVSYINRKR